MIEYFKDLSEKELASFRRFVHSPYHNRNNNVIKLFEFLESLYPEISPQDLTYESISEIIFPSKKIDESKLRKLLSDFTNVMEKFLMQEEMSKNHVTNNIMLLRVLRKKGMRKRFEKTSKELINIQKNSYSRDDDFYLNEINLEHELYLFGLNDHKVEYAKYLEKLDELTDYHFSFLKLHLFNSMHSYETEHGRKFKKGFDEMILTTIERNRGIISRKHPNIYVIYLVVRMNRSGDDKYLVELNEFLMKNERKFPLSKLSYYYHYIRAYYVSKIEQGNTAYRKDFIKLIKRMREKNILLIDEIITDMEFNSIVNNALPMGEYDWLEKFVEEYNVYLNPEFASSAFNLAKAKIEYYRKNYDQIFQYLNELDHGDPVYYLNAKFLLGRVFFEMLNYDSTRYIINNLKQYIRQKKNLTELQKKITENYNRYLSELLKLVDGDLKLKGGEAAILKKELDKERNHLPAKQWFYDMLSKM